MGFMVDAAGLAGLPIQLDRLKLDALRGSGYVGDHAKMSYGGVLNHITADHERIVHDVRAYLDKLGGPVAGNTADAVRAALAYYGHADTRAAAALDASYPAGDRHAGEGPSSYSSAALGYRLFQDAATPSSHYVAPGDHHAEFPDEPSSLDQISPAAAGRYLIVHATELAEWLGVGHKWDPYEEILKPVTGDWKGLRGCADVFRNVGAAAGDLALNLRTAAHDVPDVWTGNAADGPTGYLLAVAEQLDGAQQPFADLADAYQKAAEGAFENFRQAGELLNELIDLVLLFIAEVSTAMATAETGVGAVVLGGIAIADAFEVVKLVHLVSTACAAAEVGLKDLCAHITGSDVTDIQAKLPALDPADLRLPGDQSGVGRTKVGAAR